MYPVLSSKNVLIEGELAIRGKLLQQNRYGVLFDDLFVLFKSHSDWTKKEKPLTLVPTEAISMVKLDKDNCLELVFSIGFEANSMSLALPSLTARQWSECLTRIKERYSTPDRERLLAFKYSDIMSIPKFWNNVADIALANYDATLCYGKLPADGRGNIDFEKLDALKPQLERRRKGVVFSGVLRKRSPKALFGQAVLQERYFELYPHVLVYHKKKEEPILGLILLTSLVDATATEDILELTIQQKTKERTMTLQCTSASEANTWRDYIHRAKANYYKDTDIDLVDSDSEIQKLSHSNIITQQHQQVAQCQVYKLDEDDDVLAPMPSMEMSQSFITTASFTSVGEKRESVLAASSHLAPETRVIRRPPPRSSMTPNSSITTLGANQAGSGQYPHVSLHTTSPAALSPSPSPSPSPAALSPSPHPIQAPIDPPALPPKNNRAILKTNLFQHVKKMQHGSTSTSEASPSMKPSAIVTDSADNSQTPLQPSRSFGNTQPKPLGDREYFDKHDVHSDDSDDEQPTGKGTPTIRGLVSKKKKRYRKDGFDLDLTYITPHIVAMGFPSEGHESLYRNRMSDVQQFLNTKHPHKYKVYNLCSEREYPPDRFYQCARYPFDDHNPCPIRMLFDICRDAGEFLGYHTSSENQRINNQGNVVVVHCKAGKGRTGLVICALLMYMHHPRAQTAYEALQFYGEQRTRDGKGVTIPSQIRFVHFFEMILHNYTFRRYTFPSLDRTVVLTSIKLTPKIDFDTGGGSDPYVIIQSMRTSKKKLYHSLKDSNVITKPEGHWFGSNDHSNPFTLTNLAVPLNGEVLFIFKDKDRFSKNETMFRFWIQTSFIARPTIVLTKSQLDKADRDTKCENFPDDFHIELTFRPIHESEIWPCHIAVDDSVENASQANIDACGTGMWLSPPIDQMDQDGNIVTDHSSSRLRKARQIIAHLCKMPSVHVDPDKSILDTIKLDAPPLPTSSAPSSSSPSSPSSPSLPAKPSTVTPQSQYRQIAGFPSSPSSLSPPPVPNRTLQHNPASPRVASSPPPLPPRSASSFHRKLDGTVDASSQSASQATSFTLNPPQLADNQSSNSLISEIPLLAQPDNSMDVIRSVYPLNATSRLNTNSSANDGKGDGLGNVDVDNGNDDDDDDDDDDYEFNTTCDDLITTKSISQYDDDDDEDYNLDFGDDIDDGLETSRKSTKSFYDDDTDDDDYGSRSTRSSVSRSINTSSTTRESGSASDEQKSKFSFGNITNIARQLVSKKKRRYQEDGFDLDLTYITPHIVAMGFPSEGHESLYRNRMSDVQKFLNTKHPHKYKVYNLCSEREYPPDRFERCASYPFDDHNPSPFQLILQFCQDASNFLKQDPENTVFVHCKAGKGRTGLMITALLLFTEQCSTAVEALEYYGIRRTSNANGVTIASQARFVLYFQYFLEYIHRQRLTASFAFSGDKIIITAITLKGQCHFDPGGGCDPYFEVSNMNGIVVYNYKQVAKKIDNWNCKEPFAMTKSIFSIQGETKFTFYDQDAIGQDEYMFHFWLHTAFHSGIAGGQGEIILMKCDLDGPAANDKKCKNIGSNFSVCIYYKVSDEIRYVPI